MPRATEGSAARRRIDPRFWRFLLVGVLNTAFGYSLFLVLAHSPLPLFVAMLLANVGAIGFNFRTTGQWVFGSRDFRLLGRFFAGYGVHFLINYVALRALLAFDVPLVPASAGLLVPMAVLSFLINRHFVFDLPAPEDRP